MKNKKYELVEDRFITYKGRKLYRIRALDRIDSLLGVNRGDLGGYVEGYHNLSQEGICWVYCDAVVYGNARVSNSASVGSNAEVHGNARIEDNAVVGDEAEVYGNAEVRDHAKIEGYAKVYGNARVISFAAIKEKSRIYGNAKVTDSTYVWNSEVFGNAKVTECAKIFDNFLIHGNARIGEFTELDEGAKEYSGNCAIFDPRYT
jgi:carbonic anhydrase/acetyltransferase-like protein (isoleucine patch superfamily)